MGKLPKLRCPVCGKISFFPNFVGFHKLEAFVLHFSSGGRGLGRIVYEKQNPKGDFIAYWIRRLKEVITYLESLQPQHLRKAKQQTEVISKRLVTNYKDASETSVSPLMITDNGLLKSGLMKLETLIVPNSSGASFRMSKNLSASFSSPRTSDIRVKAKLKNSR